MLLDRMQFREIVSTHEAGEVRERRRVMAVIDVLGSAALTSGSTAGTWLFLTPCA